MAVRHSSIEVILASALAPAGTLTVNYPTGTSRTNFVRGVKHKLLALGAIYESPTTISVALNGASAVVTYNGTTTIPAGTKVVVQLDAGGSSPYGTNVVPPARVKPISDTGLFLIEIGNPVAGAANAICASQSVNSGVAALLNGSTAGVLDVPRNVVAAWTNTAVCTVTGVDEFGNTVVESSASGVNMAGVKAFARVTNVTFNANVTGATVGTGNVLGLPVFLPGAGNVLREVQDLAVATAGTIVAGLSAATKSTATTADVRGTYTPNATPNGTIAYALTAWLEDPAHRGNPQFAGS